MPTYYRYFFICMGLIFVLTLGAIIISTHHSDVDLHGNEESYPYSNCYVKSEGKVYYNRLSDGYYLVKGADVKTFKPLNVVSDYGTTGKDSNHVYFKTEIIPGLKPAESIYLGNNFITNQRQVFYGNILLKQADAATFTHLFSYYSFDKKHLYYKQNIVNGADANTLKPIKFDANKNNRPIEYVRDKYHVYYKGALIKRANPASFTYLYVEDDQWNTQYAFDGSHYFYQQNIILVNNDINATHLKLLTLDKGFGWHGIFYQGTAIYCYDTDKRELVLLGNRDNSASFSAIDRGVFTDGKHVYFTYGDWNWAGGRTHGLMGHTTGICVAQGANPANFKAIGKFKGKPEGTIYQSGSNSYFHATYTGDGGRHPGLRVFEADGTIKDLPLGDAMSKFFRNSSSGINWAALSGIFNAKRDSDYNDR